MTISKSTFHEMEKKSFMNFMKMAVVLFLAMTLIPLTSHAEESSGKYVLMVISETGISDPFISRDPK